MPPEALRQRIGNVVQVPSRILNPRLSRGPTLAANDKLVQSIEPTPKAGVHIANSSPAQDKPEQQTRTNRLKSFLGGLAIVSTGEDIYRKFRAKQEHSPTASPGNVDRNKSGTTSTDIDVHRHSPMTRSGYAVLGGIQSSRLAWEKRRSSRRLRKQSNLDSRPEWRQKEVMQGKIAAVAAVVLGVIILKHYGADVVPSHIPFTGNAHIPFTDISLHGDGDGVDLSPVKGGFIHGPNSWFGGQPDGWFTDDKIASGHLHGLPFPHETTGTQTPPVTIPLPDTSWFNPNVTPSALEHGVPLIKPTHINDGDGLFKLVHDVGHQIVGPKFNTSNTVHVASQFVPQSSPNSAHLIGSNDPGFYTMPGGLGIRGTGNIELTETAARRLVDLVKAEPLAP